MPQWLKVSPPLSPEVSQEPCAAADAQSELEKVAEELRAEKAAFGILVLPEDYPLPDVPDSPGFFCPSPEAPDAVFVLGSDSGDSAPGAGSPAESVELSDTGSAEIDRLFENVPLTPELLGTGPRRDGYDCTSRRASSPRRGLGLGVFGASSAGGEDTGATGKRSPFSSSIFSTSPRPQTSRASSPFSPSRLRHRLRRRKSLDTLLAYSARVALAETAARQELAEREARRKAQEARMRSAREAAERARRFLARDEAVEGRRGAAEAQDRTRGKAGEEATAKGQGEAATVLAGVTRGLGRLSGWFGGGVGRGGGASASVSVSASPIPLRSLSTPSKHGMPGTPGDV